MRIRDIDTNNLTEFLTLVRHVMGQKWFLKNTPENCWDLPKVREKNQKRVMDHVHRMSPEKLGWICAHSTYHGMHTRNGIRRGTPRGQRPPFLNEVGLLTTAGHDFEMNFPHPDAIANRPFRDFMEYVAVATIIAFAIDIVWQDVRQERWGKEDWG